MYTKTIRLLLLVLAGVFLAAPAARCATIVWVATSEATDQSYVDLLVANGYTVSADFRSDQGATLDAARIAALNAADLIIVSRHTDSGRYDDGDETAQWNAIRTPMLSLSAYMPRSHRWGWLDTEGTNNANATMEVVLADHPILAGVPLGAANQIDVVTSALDFASTADFGNGNLIARRADNGQVWIAEWNPGVEFYEGSGRSAAGKRMFFATRSSFNLTADGEKLLLNAIAYLLVGEGPADNASVPSPAHGATDVPPDGVLSWTPGEFAATHDVYFGTSFDEVTAASIANPLSVWVSQGQDANSFDPDGRLTFGETYYWRVDEVNAAPDNTVYKGDVWSFTAEPFTYPVAEIIATASIPTSPGAQGPERTVDGSGIDDAGQQSLSDVDMWLGDASAGGPTWIQYDFDRVYKLYDVHVWNYNTIYEAFVGFGVKDVTIEYAADANDWTVLGDYEIGRASDLADYAGMTIDLGGIAARSVRMNISSSWGGEAKYGLGEVRFSYIPVNAREPQPASGTTGLDPSVVLSWRAGREAASHQVSLGTDQEAVANDLALFDTVAANTYDLGSVSLGTTYYWKIDEVNEAQTPSVWASDVWSFTTRPYTAIDNFESYTDDEGSRLFDIWLDGYGVATNGSLVGHESPPYAEKTISHAGQSMPLYYGNTAGVANSEAELAFTAAQDWTANGADTLSLWFRGDPIGFVESSAGLVVMNGIGTDIWGTADQGRFVYKQLTGNATIVARVDHLDATDPWAKAGVMIRQVLGPGSSWAVALASAANGVHFQARLTLGASAVSDTSLTLPEEQTAAAVPVWVKLERVGSQFNAYYATDEAPTTWIANPWNPQTVEMADPVYIGLAVTSHNASAVTQAVFSNIATTGNVTGAWQSASLTVDQPEGNGVDTFYVAVEDSAGQKATLTHPDPYAVGAGVWTQWLVPLSDISAAGVNTESVKKFSIGVGDATKPSQNASGVMYIDDIEVGHPIPTP